MLQRYEVCDIDYKPCFYEDNEGEWVKFEDLPTRREIIEQRLRDIFCLELVKGKDYIETRFQKRVITPINLVFGINIWDADRELIAPNRFEGELGKTFKLTIPEIADWVIKTIDGELEDNGNYR